MSLYATPPGANLTADERRIRHAQLMYLMGIGDGGLPSGPVIDPRLSFWAPLTNSLIPTKAGNPVFTFSRASLGYVRDHEGILRNAVANEARFQGARRVRNTGLGASEGNVWGVSGSLSPTSGVLTYGGKSNASFITFPAASNGASTARANSPVATPSYTSQVAAGITSVMSFYIALSRPLTGAESIQFQHTGNVGLGVVTLTASSQPGAAFQRFAAPPTLSSGFNGGIYIEPFSIGASPITVYVWGLQIEFVDGQSNQAPGEYVSVGVLAAPYHGNAIDGVKYFATTNGNSVAANVVTEATGTLIPAATLLGYLAENASTNLCKESQTFDVGGGVGWAPTNSTIGANTQAAPDGTLTADRFTDDATSGFHRIQGNVATVSGVYTHSIYLKAGTLTWMQLGYFDFTTTFWANFNIATGAIGFKQAGTTATITALPNGWYRCAITFTTASSGISLIYSANADTNATNISYVGTGQTMYLWGAQVETGSDPSSYVPTTTVAVVRNTDNLSYQMASNLDRALATTYSEVYPFTAKIANNPIIVHLLPDNFQPQFYFAPNGTLSLQSPSGIRSTANFRNVGAVNKNATAWSGTTVSLCLNGGAVGTGAFVAYNTLGTFLIGGPAGQNPDGTIRNVKFYNVRIADADLITMTA